MFVVSVFLIFVIFVHRDKSHSALSTTVHKIVSLLYFMMCAPCSYLPISLGQPERQSNDHVTYKNVISAH